MTPGPRKGNRETLKLPDGEKFRVFSNLPMAGSPSVTRAVVVIHGTGRNAEGYYDSMTAAAQSAGVEGETLVVAPWFKNWSSDEWKMGGGDPSSFAVADELLNSLADHRRFPKLTHITVTGHSAGGQFTQRYAVFGRAPNHLPWVNVNYVAMNPSSFVYLDKQRPESTSGCSDFNTYKYGLDDREGYVAELTPQQAADQYALRTVTIVNGNEDTVDNGDLDTGCEADAQGPSRLARGKLFIDRIKQMFPTAPHDYLVVNGVAHDSEAMFADPVTWPSLFGVTRP